MNGFMKYTSNCSFLKIEREDIKMSKLKEKILTGGITVIMMIAILIFAYGLSWILICGIIKLITMCFGFTFKWSIATDIWLIMCLLSMVFKSSN